MAAGREDMSGDIAAVLKHFVSVISEGGPSNDAGDYRNRHLTSLLYSRVVLLVTATAMCQALSFSPSLLGALLEVDKTDHVRTT